MCEILYATVCSKFSSFAPEGFETTLFQNGCLGFRPPFSSDVCLSLRDQIVCMYNSKGGLGTYRLLQVNSLSLDKLLKLFTFGA
jgi:hypothetical protein